MAGGSGKVQVVLEEGSEAVVVRNGIKVEFNTSGSFPAGVYRSSAPYDGYSARVQCFGGGGQSYYGRGDRLPVRLVW